MPHASAIDGFEFARSNSSLSGTRRAGDFPRLREILRSPDGSLQYALKGLPEVQGRPALQLKVAGTLALQCQRCLGPLDFALRAETLLLLYGDEAELAARSIDADGPEGVVGARDMPVLTLVEDEVLLAVPYAPRHEDCRASAGEAGVDVQRPFARLRSLMDGKH